MKRSLFSVQAVRGFVTAGVLLQCSTFGYFARAEPETPAPEAVVSSLHRALVEMASSDEGLDREQRYSRLEPVVTATHDLEYIAELTIRRQWRELDAAERSRFVAAFQRLSVMTYATRFSGVGPNALSVLGSEDAGSGRVLVHAAIDRGETGSVSLDYLLREDSGGWRIINILADGVSDLALKRAEYQRILATGTFDDLLAALATQTDNL